MARDRRRGRPRAEGIQGGIEPRRTAAARADAAARTVSYSVSANGAMPPGWWQSVQ
jgi:hypothetical protein